MKEMNLDFNDRELQTLFEFFDKDGSGDIDLGDCAAKHCGGKVAGCAVCVDVERGTVFDEGLTQRLRMLLSNSSSNASVHYIC